jgi:hypothetical protein
MLIGSQKSVQVGFIFPCRVELKNVVSLVLEGFIMASPAM